MRINTENVARWASLMLETFLIFAAGTAIFFPELRTGGLKAVVTGLFLAQGALLTYRGWTDGTLRLTLNELFHRIRQTGPIKRSRLENLAVFVGFIAVVVIRWP